MSEDYFNISKLYLYLNMSIKGFILLTVNEKHLQEELINDIKEMKKCTIYDLNDFSVKNTSQNDNEQLAIYKCINFNKKEMSILEKINLSRDILLKQEKLFIFIVPKYIAELIQQNFPNLYSYFILKESFTKKYDIFFEYIFPNSGYLVSKESQRESKRYYQITQNEDINDKLNYFLHAKASPKELNELDNSMSNLLKKADITKEYNLKYYFNLLFKFAKMLLRQGRYTEAEYIFSKLSNELSAKRTHSKLYYESLIGAGDAFFHLKEYEKAKRIYEDTIIDIINLDILTLKEEDDYFHKIIYSRLALCYIEEREYSRALSFMESAFNTLIEDCDKKHSGEFFDIYYNYFLILMNQNPNNCYIINSILSILNKMKKNYIQEAMFLSISAWYNGVMMGNLKSAFKNAQNALSIKRNVFIENDIRIAESHYLNSVLYFINGEYEKAYRCCHKCSNILKNFQDKFLQEELVEKLYDDIVTRLL